MLRLDGARDTPRAMMQLRCQGARYDMLTCIFSPLLLPVKGHQMPLRARVHDRYLTYLRAATLVVAGDGFIDEYTRVARACARYALCAAMPRHAAFDTLPPMFRRDTLSIATPLLMPPLIV